VSGYQVVSLRDLETAPHRGSNLIPLRIVLGYRAAGINAWIADAGGQLVPPHEEDSGNDELYVVVSGRATFALGEEEVAAPAGTLVFVPPQVHRAAVAAEDGTIVFVAGATAGEPFLGGAWDTFAVADGLRRAGRIEEGRAVLRREMEARPGSWALAYNAACLEALAGNLDEAFRLLRRALERNSDEIYDYLREDSDLDRLRGDPRFEELLEGGREASAPPSRPTGAERAPADAAPAAPAHARVDELEAIELPEGWVWRPVRRRFGIRAFGVNAFTPGASGTVIEAHSEDRSGHEEVYLVLRGRVRFTVGDDAHELGPTDLVCVRDPSLPRQAVARTSDAAVLAVGAAPGRAFEISAWEETLLSGGRPGA